ncbi:hypothetical protein MTR_7g080113 [Medicago truncatula]|uniref:Uncharacterized protein n=1 Tax=Medicago truncatula TaxID=3880 RepID=A0A072UC26_MEDTR|nr:hypothetical protein MTR_7g080113 [Medicago truncatula]
MDRVTIPENRFLTQIQFFKTIEFQSTQLCSPFLLRRFSSNLKVIERRGDGKTTTVNTSNYDVSDDMHFPIRVRQRVGKATEERSGSNRGERNAGGGEDRNKDSGQQ